MSHTPPRPSLALAGVLTGLAGVATSQAVAWALGAPNAPVVAVASAVRDFTPGPVAIRLVEWLQHADKPLLITGTVLIMVTITGYAGVLSFSRPLLTDLVFIVLAVIALGAVLRLDDSTVASSLAVIVGLVTWIVVLRMLTAPLGEEHLSAPARRSFLIRGSATIIVMAAVAGAGRLAGRGRREVEKARRLLRLPVTSGTVPAGVSGQVRGLEPWRTQSGRFYRVDSVIAPPTITPREWSLRVHGMVSNELRISYAELVEMELTEDWITLCCVSNVVGGGLIGNAWWSGVPIRQILRRAGVQPGADAVLQTSKDGWTCGTPLTTLTDDRNALLAVAMNGRPLPVEHGFPVRMVVPGLFGYVSATKWLVDLEVTRFGAFSAFWTERGWSEKGPVRTQSRIEVPRSGATVAAGSVPIGGTAWAQHTGVTNVEYQLDGGGWQMADLARVPNLDTWVQWHGTVPAAAGKHTLAVRATDRSGYTQTAVRRDVIPDGATGWHTIDFEAKA